MEDERADLGLIKNTRRKFKNIDELKESIDEYFNQRFANHLPPTISGLALHLGVTRNTLLNYEKRYAGTEYAEVISEAKLRIEDFVETCLFKHGIATGVIFNLKNNFDWKEKQDITNEVKVTRLEDVL